MQESDSKNVSKLVIMGVKSCDSWIMVRGHLCASKRKANNDFHGVDSKKEVNLHAYTIIEKWLKSTEKPPKFLAIGKQGKVSLGTLFENIKITRQQALSAADLLGGN